MGGVALIIFLFLRDGWSTFVIGLSLPEMIGGAVVTESQCFFDLGSRQVRARRVTRLGAIVRYSDATAQEPGYLTDADAYTRRRIAYPISETDGGTRRIGQ